jgi:hypothetical protein
MLMRKIVQMGVEVDQLKLQLAQKSAAEENLAKIDSLGKSLAQQVRGLDELRKAQEELANEVKRKQNRSSAVAVG